MIYFLYFIFISYLSINFEKYKQLYHLEKITFFILFLIIGLRYRTGGDFRPYIDTFDRVAAKPSLPNPFTNLFEYINYVSNILNLNIFGVNLFCSLIFTYFLYFFLKKFKNIYLSLVLAFPVIVMVYGIGSIRQGISIVLFLSIFSLRSQLSKTLILIISIFFHFTSIINLFIYFFASSYKKKNSYILYIFLFILILLIFAYNDQIFKYIKYYIFQDIYESKGFLLRNTLTLICALIYCKIYLNNNLQLDNDSKYIFFIISLLSILFFILGLFYSTPADRIMAYFLPLQLVVINFLYEQFQNQLKKKLNYLICSSMFLILGVWYFLGDNSRAWEYELFFFPVKF